MLTAEQILNRLDEEGVRVTLVRRPERPFLALSFPERASETARKTVCRIVARQRHGIAEEIRRRGEQADDASRVRPPRTEQGREDPRAREEDGEPGD